MQVQDDPIARAPRPERISRRETLAFLSASAVLLGTTAMPCAAQAEQAPDPAATQQFSFDILTGRMRDAAAAAPRTGEISDSFLTGLTYDDYQKIQFRPDRARWQEAGALFRVQAFHLGWLYKEPVRIYAVEDGTAREMVFTVEDFDYRGALAGRVPKDEKLPGVAGFRLNTPLNRADTFDELVAFLGASYFRALGRGNVYGLSARGLALNTGMGGAEEFPRFTAFYLDKPAPGAAQITLYAALESPSLTGAYRFVITPGADTVMAVTARLFLRADVAQLGVAPLTSMYLFGENDPGDFDDFRPEVHDSDGLMLEEPGGRRYWRPLNNPPQLASSFFESENPRAFGLCQRDRDFADYLDVPSAFQRRPSLVVMPTGDWGKGAVRLVEIPSELETNDNIVAFWVPQAPARAGDALEFAYRLNWGDLPVDTGADTAYVRRTRTGHGGVSGVKPKAGTRKFVVDFAGGLLGGLPQDAEVVPKISVAKGTIAEQALDKIPGSDTWRLVFDVAAEVGAIVEMSAVIEGYGRTLTETWLYQWIKE